MDDAYIAASAAAAAAALAAEQPFAPVWENGPIAGQSVGAAYQVAAPVLPMGQANPAQNMTAQFGLDNMGMGPFNFPVPNAFGDLGGLAPNFQGFNVNVQQPNNGWNGDFVANNAPLNFDQGVFSGPVEGLAGNFQLPAAVRNAPQVGQLPVGPVDGGAGNGAPMPRPDDEGTMCNPVYRRANRNDRSAVEYPTTFGGTAVSLISVVSALCDHFDEGQYLQALHWANKQPWVRAAKKPMRRALESLLQMDFQAAVEAARQALQANNADMVKARRPRGNVCRGKGQRGGSPRQQANASGSGAPKGRAGHRSRSHSPREEEEAPIDLAAGKFRAITAPKPQAEPASPSPAPAAAASPPPPPPPPASVSSPAPASSDGDVEMPDAQAENAEGQYSARQASPDDAFMGFIPLPDSEEPQGSGAVVEEAPRLVPPGPFYPEDYLLSFVADFNASNS